jgi:hypothetical protein
MFIAYEVSLELITSLRRIVPTIEQHDRDRLLALLSRLTHPR